ncbi:MAG: protein sorting system archaetidylserine decarboxylase [Halobacteriaceae archaeon]
MSDAVTVLGYRFAPGARRFAFPLLVASVPAVSLGVAPGLALAAAGVAVLLFYRDPQRSPPPGGVLAPADGRVSVVRAEGDRLRVGVFMSPTDVHVNRSPLAGTVAAVDHEPGGHRPAFDKEAESNERVHVDLGDCEVTLIAGAFARRITPYVDQGDELDRGERIGHIAFGSRADVLLPPAVDRDGLRVATGDRVRAGESVLARFPPD